MTFIETENIIVADGWYLDSVNGSHYNYKHPTKRGKVTIPRHSRPKDLNIKTIKSIFKQAQIKR